jgi:hypothetical protein
LSFWKMDIIWEFALIYYASSQCLHNQPPGHGINCN